MKDLDQKKAKLDQDKSEFEQKSRHLDDRETEVK